MNYKYPPIYKYGLLLLTIYMFIKHQKILPPDKILINSIFITLIVFIYDNIIIKNHPSILLDNSNKKREYIEDFEEELSEDEINTIINSFNDDADF